MVKNFRIYKNFNLSKKDKEAIILIGNFDGLHRGHQKLFNKAKKSEDPEHDHVSESDFRYPGPRPQSREAAIVMLADACEAATRSINEPTPSKIETMVHSIINRRFLEEQFNECDLTLSDLRVIEACFVRTLVSLYHHRVQYPGQKTDTVPNPPSSPPLSNIRKIQGN